MNETAIYYSIISGLALCFSMVTCIFSILAYAKVLGLEQSTHKIEWVPVDNNEEEKLSKKDLKEMSEDLFKEVI